MLRAICTASASALFPQLVLAAASGSASRTKALLDEYVASKKIAGAVAVLGTREHADFVCAGHIALVDSAANTAPGSLWRIYSLTKLVTGAAAMILVDEGKLTLDTPVAEFLPTFGKPQVLVAPDTPHTRPAAAAVCIRHLMTHTSGLVGSMVPEPPLSTFYADRRLNVSRVSLEDDLKVRHQTSLLAFAAAAGTVPLAFDPGTQWSYGISSDVLGGVIETVSGVPFASFLKHRIFEPLGMVETDFTVSRANLGRFATNYQVSSEGLIPVDAPPRTIFAKPPPFPYPSSGLVSSARDFSRFTAMMLGEGASNGARVLTPDTARLMMSNILPPRVQAALGQGWGAGGLVLLKGTKRTPIGMRQGTYGWWGAAGTVAWVDRGARTYGVLMAQYMPSEIYDLHTDFTGVAGNDSPAR